MDTTQWLERRLRIMRIAAVAAAVAAVVAAVVWVMIRILITAGPTPDALLILAAVLAVAAAGVGIGHMVCLRVVLAEQRIGHLIAEVVTKIDENDDEYDRGWVAGAAKVADAQAGTQVRPIHRSR